MTACLAGRRAFSGSSVAETIEATLREDPDWGALPDAVPPALRSLLVRCLEKQADARPPRAGEVSRVLADLRGSRPLSAAGVTT